MAMIPTFKKLTALPIDIDDGSTPRRAINGALKIQRLYPRSKYVFSLGYKYLTGAQYTQLVDFYEAHKFNSVEFTDPNSGREYSCKIIAPPRVESQSGIYYNVSLQVEGVRTDG